MTNETRSGVQSGVRIPIRLGVAVCALAIAVGTAACGSDGHTTTETVTVTASQGSSPTSNTTSAVTSESSPQLPSGAADTLGSAQTVSGDGYVAKITVKRDFSTSRDSSGATVVTVPVSIDVQSGRLTTESSDWRLVTLSGQSIDGDTSTSNPLAIGDTPIEGHGEGVLIFSSSDKLPGEVQLSSVAMLPHSLFHGDEKPLAQWKAQTPIPVSSLPTK